MTDELLTPGLDDAAAHWQWALDAAARALDADRIVLPADVVAALSRHLREERQDVVELLHRDAAATRLTPAPWVAPASLTPQMLGLPAGTKACLFDLDGVLTDSDALHAAAWAAALDPILLAATSEERQHFVPFDGDAEYHAYFDGRLRVEGIRLFLAGRGLRLSDEAIGEIAARKGELLERGLHTHGVVARAGAHRYLQAAGLCRLRRAVVSASTTVPRMLELAELSHLVEANVDATAILSGGLRSRPAPDLLVAACDKLGAEPERAASLTHSGAGVVAAQAIGMPVIGIADGAEADALRAYGAATVVPSLLALLEPRLRGD